MASDLRSVLDPLTRAEARQVARRLVKLGYHQVSIIEHLDIETRFTVSCLNACNNRRTMESLCEFNNLIKFEGNPS